MPHSLTSSTTDKQNTKPGKQKRDRSGTLKARDTRYTPPSTFKARDTTPGGGAAAKVYGSPKTNSQRTKTQTAATCLHGLRTVAAPSAFSAFHQTRHAHSHHDHKADNLASKYFVYGQGRVEKRDRQYGGRRGLQHPVWRKNEGGRGKPRAGEPVCVMLENSWLCATKQCGPSARSMSLLNCCRTSVQGEQRGSKIATRLPKKQGK